MISSTHITYINKITPKINSYSLNRLVFEALKKKKEYLSFVDDYTFDENFFNPSAHLRLHAGRPWP